MMTTAKPLGDTTAGAMFRGAIVPSAVVAVISVVLSVLAAGTTGLWGSLLGVALVLTFFGLSLVVLGATRAADPLLVLMVALALYGAKVVGLFVAFILINAADLVDDPFDRTALGITVIVCTLTWTVGEIVGATRRREPLYDLGEASP
ncbi:hypothetical protein [Solicola gregarius]|uniref:ATP synthase protein I n=1 Tax=Solicola gregarius TaxID=2908642 RepID=A0AA46YKP4_9ACTN|nr:hypothetical protein [Solicola gregarius]UYM05985.1 hypothetical protein L0C25_02610 [Solicola gregarius]